MTDKDLHAKKKTRAKHEAEMAEVAAAIRRMFIKEGLIEGPATDPNWTMGRALHALGGRHIEGRVVAVFEAAIDVWTAFNSVYGVREGTIGVLSDLNDGFDVALGHFAAQPTQTYLANMSRWGSMFGMQDEPRTATSRQLEARAVNVADELRGMSTRLDELIAALMERRPPAVRAGFYGPKGRGPRAHFAYELHVRGFDDREIALIRGDVPFANEPADAHERDVLRKNAEPVRLEIVRAKKAIEALSKEK